MSKKIAKMKLIHLIIINKDLLFNNDIYKYNDLIDNLYKILNKRVTFVLLFKEINFFWYFI